MVQMTPNPDQPRESVSRRRSRNPAWDTLQGLAIEYLALPPAPNPPQVHPEREELRKKIRDRLMRTYVDLVVADVDVDNEEAAKSVRLDCDDLGVDSRFKLLRRDSALEALFRAEAKKFAHMNGSHVADAKGGITELVAEAGQDFLDKRLERYGKRKQTLLSGLLLDWNIGKGSLYTFMSAIVRNSLIDLARREKQPYGAPLTEIHPKDLRAYDGGVDEQEWMLSLDQVINREPEAIQHLFRTLVRHEIMESSDKEICADMGLKRSTLNNKRKLLRKALGRSEDQLFGDSGR